MRVDGGIDQHRPAPVPLYEIGRVVAAKRRADVARFSATDEVLRYPDGIKRRGRQPGAGKFGADPPRPQVPPKALAFVRRGEKIEAVKIDDPAAATLRSRSRSFA